MRQTPAQATATAAQLPLNHSPNFPNKQENNSSEHSLQIPKHNSQISKTQSLVRPIHLNNLMSNTNAPTPNHNQRKPKESPKILRPVLTFSNLATIAKTPQDSI
jgi:hypothetical protein